MCTAITYKTDSFYFGRTLDYDFSYGENICIMPRYFPLPLRHGVTLKNHHAVIGMAHVSQGYPLYYDAVNEKGLAMAGLNFVGFAQYSQPLKGSRNVAQFEFIPWVLSQCGSVSEAVSRIKQINLTDTPFSDSLPPAQLHWLLGDAREAVTVEATESGMHIYPNPAGVLTNNPPFPEQMFHLNNYLHLSPDDPINTFSPDLPLTTYSRGMGGIGLPGDLSSQSRFVRAAFTKLNSHSGHSESESVSQFFHILDSVAQTRGCCHLGDGKYEITLYASCCNASKGIYYYTTYENRQITAVDMHQENLDGSCLIHFPLIDTQQIRLQN